MRGENFKISERIILLFYTSLVSKQISHKKKTQTNKALESIVKRYHKRSTFFKTKDPTFLTFTNLSAFRFTIRTRGKKRLDPISRHPDFVPDSCRGYGRNGRTPRIRQRGERAEKVESLIYMRFRGRPHGFTTKEKPKKEYRTSLPVQGTDFDSAISFHLVLGRSFFPCPDPSTPPNANRCSISRLFRQVGNVGEGEKE